jgi:hypothetical protein
MNDDNFDDNVPTEAELNQAYGSAYLGVVDIVKKIKAAIQKVRMKDIKDRDSGRMKKRAVVWFSGLDKPLVLNTTNKHALEDALGKNAANWEGAVCGIWVDPSVSFGGVRKGGVRLRVLSPPPRSEPAAPIPSDAPSDNWEQVH